MIKLIFKAYEKANKIFFYIFFSIHKNGKQLLSKTQRKTRKRST